MIITPGQLTHRANFYFQLASLLAAGVPMLQALEMTRSSQSGKYHRQTGIILAKLEQGFTLGEAVNATGTWLPDFDRALFMAGEQSGRLDSAFRTLGAYYTDRATMLRQIITGLAYPVFILHLAIFIFPTSYLVGLLNPGGGKAFIIQKTALLLPSYLLVAAGIFAFQASHGAAWRGILERFTNAPPLVGSARRDLAFGRLAGALEALISAGVTIIQAWDLAATATASPRIRKTVTKLIPRMEAGMTPAETMRETTVFPEMFRSLYTTGETSGQLDQTLKRLQNYYEEQASLKLQAIASWTPKLAFFIIAIAIGYQIIKFYSGHFDQLNKMGL